MCNSWWHELAVIYGVGLATLIDVTEVYVLLIFTVMGCSISAAYILDMGAVLGKGHTNSPEFLLSKIFAINLPLHPLLGFHL